MGSLDAREGCGMHIVNILAEDSNAKLRMYSKVARGPD